MKPNLLGGGGGGVYVGRTKVLLPRVSKFHVTALPANHITHASKKLFFNRILSKSESVKIY